MTKKLNHKKNNMTITKEEDKLMHKLLYKKLYGSKAGRKRNAERQRKYRANLKEKLSTTKLALKNK